MAKRIMTLDKNRVREFVRGQISFAELTDNLEESNKVTFAFDDENDPYEVSLDDVVYALEHLADAGVDGSFVFNDWFNGFYYDLGDLININKMIGMDEDRDDAVEYQDASDYPFFASETELAGFIIETLLSIDDERWDYFDDDISTYCTNELKELLTIIHNYALNKGKPHDQWILTEKQKKTLIWYFDKEERIRGGEPDDLQRYKDVLVELAQQDDVDALRMLGYAYYGDDNPVFPCDWDKSRDCFLKLMDIAPDRLKAQAACTLGYIYYYGRCNGGIPQYDEAYRYFSLAAFYGYYEAIYKVADMIRDGKGIFRNEEAAFRMYEYLYEENYNKFLHNSDCVLSDVALRIASCYQHGTGTFKYPEKAYIYYLVARLAIDERMKRSNFFGLTTVSASIRTGLSEVREQLGDWCRQKYVSVDASMFIPKYLLTGDVRDVKVKVRKLNQGYNLTFTRIRPQRYAPEPYMLLVYPTISYCVKTTSVKLFVPEDCDLQTFASADTFTFDDVKVEHGRVHLYSRRKLVLSSEDISWQLRPERAKGSDVMHKFVSIQFEPGGKSYDYLCDGMDVKAGDRVVIPGIGGPAEVEAMRVFEQSEADAPLDIVRYKSVIKVL